MNNQSSQQDFTKFENLVKLYELNSNVANQLREVLSTCEVVLVCDDSSSMARPVVEPGADPFAMNLVTRWSELKKLAGEVIKFVTSMNSSGLDIYFLNRGIMRNVTDVTGLQTSFATLPDGGTPLITTLKQVYNEKKDILYGKKLLIVVVTDGEPTDKDQYDYSNSELFSLINLMTSRGDIHISIAETTDDPGSMDFLDNWNGKIKNFDNTDDYREELAKVRMTMGMNFKFDYTDYVIKILLATFIRWYFNLDQQNNLNRVSQFGNQNFNNKVTNYLQPGKVINYQNFQNDFPNINQINNGNKINNNSAPSNVLVIKGNLDTNNNNYANNNNNNANNNNNNANNNIVTNSNNNAPLLNQNLINNNNYSSNPYQNLNNNPNDGKGQFSNNNNNVNCQVKALKSLFTNDRQIKNKDNENKCCMIL